MQVAPLITDTVASPELVTSTVLVAWSTAIPVGFRPTAATGQPRAHPAVVWLLHRAMLSTDTVALL